MVSIRLDSLDIIVPVYNEEDALEAFHRQLCQVIDPLTCAVKIVYINDGSQDNTQIILNRLAQEDERVIPVELSRNFGHQAALTAGLDLSEGQAAITLDGDGQHPPELIPQMLLLYQAGYDIVSTQRVEDTSISLFKRFTSAAFYRLINLLGDTEILPGSADFRLISRQVVDALRKMPEYHRFLRGMIPWMGFRSVILPYQPRQRLGGKSKYSLQKMVRLSLDSIFSFSLVPLRIGISIGVFFLFLALVEMFYVLNFWLRGQQSSLAPGWSSLMFVILIVGGMLMINLGFFGIYMGYIFQEVKRRPIYLIREPHGSAGPMPKHAPVESTSETEETVDNRDRISHS